MTGRHSLAVMVVLILACVGWAWSRRPTAAEARVVQYQSQEATDAVQNQRLLTLEGAVIVHTEMLTQLQQDRNWLMGGIAMIGGLFLLVQLLQAVNLRKQLNGNGK